jgi:hypothetical protein
LAHPSDDVSDADVVIFGTLTNARKNTDDTTFTKGTTDLTVEQVIKGHDSVKGKKIITIAHYVPADPKAPNQKYLVFFKLMDGKLDVVRGEAIPADSTLPDYLKKAIVARSKDVAGRLNFFFDYLGSPDALIRHDAYAEFGDTEYKDIRALAEKWKGDPARSKQLLAWLKEKNTPFSRLGLYALLLGHCGKPEDANTLLALISNPDHSYSSGFNGVLAGYIMLDPKAGWGSLLGTIRVEEEFSERYACLQVVRFFWDRRPDIIPTPQVMDAMKILMAQPDMADLSMDDFRKRKLWDQTDVVLSYAAKESHNSIPIVNRSILKFALAAAAADPKNAEAVAFVKKAREKDPHKVEHLEGLLKEER